MTQRQTRNVNSRVAIFNLDGCVSDDRWRRERVNHDAHLPEHFAHYHDGAKEDGVLQYGAAILHNHIANGDFIVFATGRDMHRAEATAQWIRSQFSIEPNQDFIILMRDPKDHRAVVEVKRDFIKYLQTSFCPQNEKTVVAAYDNRRDVVLAYLEAGYDATLLNEDGEFVVQGADAVYDRKVVDEAQRELVGVDATAARTVPPPKVIEHPTGITQPKVI
jgi:hypothetical protein